MSIRLVPNPNLNYRRNGDEEKKEKMKKKQTSE